jgi:hypothetical protein
MKKIIKGIFLTSLILFVFLAGIAIGRIWEYSKNSNLYAYVLGKRLGVEPEWDSIRQKIYCEILVIGKPWEQIQSELTQVDFYGSKKVDLENRYNIYFDSMFVSASVGDLALYFDEKDNLVYKGIWVGAGGFLELPCQ